MGLVRMTVIAVALGAAACSGLGGPWFIPGTGVLPACDEPPSSDVSGWWYDNGTITILSDGCAGTSAGEMLTVCALDWQLAQDGNEVNVVVDDEYELEGRICGDQLHLRGGWWLPTRDGDFGCTYEEDTAEEVGLMAEGNVLTVTDEAMSGTLVVRGACDAEYAVTFGRRL